MGDILVSGFAPKVLQWDSTGIALQYECSGVGGPSVATVVVLAEEGKVRVNFAGGTKYIWFTIVE